MNFVSFEIGGDDRGYSQLGHAHSKGTSYHYGPDKFADHRHHIVFSLILGSLFIGLFFLPAAAVFKS